jgi:FKBP-type peptidyl-prolyl cis-trans isomerase
MSEQANIEPKTSLCMAPQRSASVDPTNAYEELMYALGVHLGRQLGDVRPLIENGDEFTFVAKGLLDTVIGRLSEEGQRLLLDARQQELDYLINERATRMNQDGLIEAGLQMLRTMAETDGVQVLPSGVCLHILDSSGGRGARPSESSVIRVHYHGTLADGTVFYSTLGEREPLSYALSDLIPGTKEGILRMREGETAMIGIPPNMAYGREGTPDGKVPGNASIFFKVQLVEVLSNPL